MLCRCLTPAATTVDVERLFSESSEILDDKRSCLNPDRLDRIIFLRKNMFLFNFDLNME